MCGVVVMDEVANLNERVDVRMEEVEEDIRTLKGEVVKLRNELRELREAHGQLSLLSRRKYILYTTQYSNLTK